MRRTARLIPAVLLGAVLVAGCGASDDEGGAEAGSEASEPTSSTPTEPEVTESDTASATTLTVDPGALTGRCAVPTPAIVGSNDLAFDGVVDTVDDAGMVTLTPTAFYAGEPTDTVTVQAPSENLQALLAAVAFEQGGRYLVAATDGEVALCTVSAPWSQQLADTYEQAFGAPQ